MPGEIRLRAARWALAACALALAGAGALAAKAELSAEVPAEKWKALRLKGLPKGGSISVRVETSGPIVVILVHHAELQRFPEPVRPAFSGTAERRMSFKVTVPVAGTYYVILDNRKGNAAREVRLFIEALPAREPQTKPSPKPRAPRGLEAT
jgi:hypothetical protein